MPRKPQSAELPPSIAEKMTPSGRVHADNPNFEKSDDALMAENFQLEDQIKAATAKFNEWAKSRKDRIAEIEGELARRLHERNTNSTKGDSGTAYFSDIMNTKVESAETLFDFVADHWDDVGADAKINIPVAVVREHMEQNSGKPPPGMSISYFRRLNIKRS
jgi:uncharacterized protein YdaT